MREKSNKYLMWCGILAVTIFLYGCANGGTAVGNQKVEEIKKEEIAYITQSLSLPEYVSFDAAFSDGYDLHYAATEFNQTSQKNETAFYILKKGAAEPEMNFRLEENQRVQNMAMDAEGNIYYIGFEEVPQDAVNGSTVPDLILYKLDSKGTPLLILDLAEYTQGKALIQDLAVDNEKRIVLSSMNQDIFLFSPEGKLLFKTTVTERIYDICSSNEKIFIGYDDGGGMSVRQIDIPGNGLSEKWKYNISGSQFYMTADKNGNLLIATEESVYEYAPEQEELVKKFDWNTYDSTGITAGILLPYEENGILAISRNYGTASMKTAATAFREAAEGEAVIQEKTVLTLGVPFRPAGINAEVVYFNKANPDYKIEIRDYDRDYSRLHADIITGNAPDLFMMPSDEMHQIALKGALEDLNPYFDNDATLDRSDFFENILEAFETEGHLYELPVSFLIRTIVGKTSVVGEASGWNLEDMLAFSNGFPKGTDIFCNTSKSGVLRLLKFAYVSQIVDADNTSTPLNRELLTKMLEFANRYESDEKYADDGGLIEKIEDGQVALIDTGISYGQAYFVFSSLCKGPVTFIGYPAEKGNGNLIYSNNTFGISSGSKHKEAAWSFIRTLLSKEAQMRMEDDYSTKGFHIRKDTLEYHFEWVRKYYDPEYGYTHLIHGDYSLRTPGEIGGEDFEQIRNLIQNADTALRTSPDIDRIIEEEAALYFNGTKPVEEVVDIIENRVRTYVDEMK